MSDERLMERARALMNALLLADGDDEQIIADVFAAIEREAADAMISIFVNRGLLSDRETAEQMRAATGAPHAEDEETASLRRRLDRERQLFDLQSGIFASQNAFLSALQEAARAVVAAFHAPTVSNLAGPQGEALAALAAQLPTRTIAEKPDVLVPLIESALIQCDERWSSAAEWLFERGDAIPLRRLLLEHRNVMPSPEKPTKEPK